MSVEVMLNGDTSVTLDEQDDDHIVVRYLTDRRGFESEITLAYGTPAWSQAVKRAKVGVAFL